MERHVLVIFPHPDDEAFNSGSLALHTNQDTPVTYVCCTLGEMGRNMGTPPFANRETLPIMRKKELQDACDAIGIKDLRMLGLRDKTLEFLEEHVLEDKFHAIINEVNPSLIITFYPGYSVHPDHDAVGYAVIRAVERIPKDQRPTVHCVAFSHNCEQELGEPDVIHDVSGVAEQKFACIKAHRSQTERFVTELEKNYKAKEPNAVTRVERERFWTYNFE